MPRILSLDKMLADLRGAMAKDNAEKGFMQGLQQGQATAAVKEAEKQKFDQAHPGVATSYLTDQGRANYDKNDAAAKGLAAGKAMDEAGQPKTASKPLPTNYDEMSQAYFKTLADMDKAEQDDPVAQELRTREMLRERQLAALDDASRRQGIEPVIPGAAPPPQGAPPPAGGYGPPAPAPSEMSPEDYAILKRAAEGNLSGMGPGLGG